MVVENNIKTKQSIVSRTWRLVLVRNEWTFTLTYRIRQSIVHVLLTLFAFLNKFHLLATTMATIKSSKSTDQPKKLLTRTDEESEYILKVGWKALFGFTTRKHVPGLLGALLGATIAALTMPVFAIVYGLIFGKYTEYGAGQISGNEMMSSITRYCIIITGLATINWISNSLYFLFFLAFGEMQARSARNRIFEALIQKDLAWYDTRETGVTALLSAIQM